MRFILLVFALVQFSCVEPRYVMVPPCHCRVNYISPAPPVHRVVSCQNKAPPRSDNGCSHDYKSTAVPYKEVHSSRTLYSKAYPQHGPEIHDEKVSYQRDYYPGHFEEDLEIESIVYEDDDHEVRHRRSVISEDEHRHEDVYRKYLEDWEDEEEEDIEDEDDGYGEMELNSEVDSSDGNEKVSEIFTQSRKQEGDLELGNVVSEAEVKSIEIEKYRKPISEQEQSTGVMGKRDSSGKDEITKISNKTKRSINDQQFRYQYRNSNQGHCSVLDRYSKNNDHSHLNGHADDCTLSKNLFFGCNMEMENEDKKETSRKARKIPKTFSQTINELKVKNERLKNRAKLSKSKSKANSKNKKAEKLNKLDNLKKNVPRNKRKDKEDKLEHEFENPEKACPCGVDENGFCPCQYQPYYKFQPIYYENPRGQVALPVRRVYHQYVPPPMPFQGYYRHY